MCGLCGFIGFKNKEELTKVANEVQKHRGPDAQAIWGDEHISLGHQRLSIIDLSERSNQPMQKENLIIVFNGEIYNYKEIKKYLSDSFKPKFKTESDTEVVLEAYRFLGEKALDLFVGMFSFAIYNTDDNSLFLARDHFGIKPLFYTFTPEGFAFASELKTLIHVPGFDKTINYRSLISSLNYLWVSGTESMFIGCNKLPPAHYMKLNKDLTYEIKRYWELKDDLEKSDEGIQIMNLSREVKESVERHMVADVPVSCFLSGGLDSSIISVLAQRQNTNLSTYTIATQEKDKKIEKMPEDDKYARQLADIFKFDHNEILIDADIINNLPKMVRTLDEPIGDPAAINTYLICKSAREKGTKVLLSGMGADEIFCGYRKQKATVFSMWYQKLPIELKDSIEWVVERLPVKTKKGGLKLARWAKRFMTFANLPLEQIFMRSYSYYDKQNLKNLLKDNHDQEIEKIFEEHENTFNSLYKDKDLINQMCQTDIKMFMLDLNLTYSDRASMAASVEVRVPFIDKLLIEHSMRIPGDLKFKNLESKYILKKVAEEFLPKTFVYRPKAAFGAPLRSWVANDLSPMIEKFLSKESVESRGIFNYDFIRKMIDDNKKGISDYAYQIYQLLTVELWFREFVDESN